MLASLKPLAALFVALTLVAMVGSAVPASAQGGVPPVANIQLASGPNSGEVVVSWDAVPQATHYRIGYVNMEIDYHLAKASCTEEWIEAFIYVDVNARNIPVSNGRGEYTVRRLSTGARHAFTVLTSNNFYNTRENAGGDFSWPQNPRWKFLLGRDTLPPGITLPTRDCSASPTGSITPSRPLTNAELAQRVRPALVKLTVRPSDGNTYAGTGFIVRPDGLVVTNRHVVDDATTANVLMLAPDGRHLDLTGQVAGRGILADLAVIRLPVGRTYPTLTLGNSDNVAQGDDITAWGYPLGSFLGDDPTLTRGIISSTNRIFDDTKYLQTDASIAPGNSGGPLVDRFGSVVGVNTAGLAQVQDDGTRVPIPGIYLAIASNEISNRLDTMAAGGPAQAIYRNLHFDYGYSMTFPKGWYLYDEEEVSSIFFPYTGRRLLQIATLPIRPPYLGRDQELSILTNYIWETYLPSYAAANWVSFRPISKSRITVSGQDFYRLEYTALWEPGLCVFRHVETISVSSSFPRKPHAFWTRSMICEDSLSGYSQERNEMLNSFRP